MKKCIIIKCPKCGYEYLPEEIFYPDKFTGKAKNITRDDNGKIIYYDGDTMNTHEEFCCYECGCTFDVDAKVTIDTKVNVNHDFSDDYVTPIYEDRIRLKEPVEDKGLWG